MAFPSPEDTRQLPLPKLSLGLLSEMSGGTWSFHQVALRFKNEAGVAADRQALGRLSDAWSWLVAHALIGPEIDHTELPGGWRLTTLGKRVVEDPSAIKELFADTWVTSGSDSAS